MASTIILVEDDLDCRDALTMLLKLEGFNVITAGDGNTALSLIESCRPDIVITDICMPGLSGVELTRVIRAHPELHKLPIIAITAATEHTRKMVLDSGASYCLAKPIDLLVLLGMIDNLLGHSTAATTRIA